MTIPTNPIEFSQEIVELTLHTLKTKKINSPEEFSTLFKQANPQFNNIEDAMIIFSSSLVMFTLLTVDKE